jgi:hypothetical protein
MLGANIIWNLKNKMGLLVALEKLYAWLKALNVWKHSR